MTTGLGLDDLLARGRRALLLAAAIALTGAMAVTALSLDATLDAQRASEATDFPDELLLLVYTLDTVLLVITATTLVAVALLSVRERIRDYGVLETIGFTPGQIVSTVISSHAALAVLASLVAIPLGIGLYLALYTIASGTSEGAVIAPWWSLALIPLGTMLVVVAATSLPAWLATRIQPGRRAPLRMTRGGVIPAQPAKHAVRRASSSRTGMLLRLSSGLRGDLRPSSSRRMDREQPPLARNALELARAAVLEDDPGAGRRDP